MDFSSGGFTRLDIRQTDDGGFNGSAHSAGPVNKPKMDRGKRQRYTKKSWASTKLATSIFPARKPKISKKWFPDPPKSILGASKIEPGAVQDVIFNRPFTYEGSKGQVQKFLEAKIVNMAPIPCAAHVPPRFRVVMKSRK